MEHSMQLTQVVDLHVAKFQVTIVAVLCSLADPSLHEPWPSLNGPAGMGDESEEI